MRAVGGRLTAAGSFEDPHAKGLIRGVAMVAAWDVARVYPAVDGCVLWETPRPLRTFVDPAASRYGRWPAPWLPWASVADMIPWSERPFRQCARHGARGLPQELLSHLAGYTERLKAVRTLTRTHDPRRDVVWSLEALTRFLEFFFFEFYNRRMHPGVASIPEQRLQEGFAVRGARETQRVIYNDAFVVATMPTAPGERLLSREKGVFLHSVRYRNAELCAQLPGDTRLGKRTVRYDPLDISRIFVPVHGRFAPFTSMHADVLSRYSVGEAQALSRAWPARMAEARRERAGEDSPMARFLARVHEEQEARKARVRTQSNRQAVSASSSGARRAEASSTRHKTGTGPADRWSCFRVGSQASGSDSDRGA